MGVRCSWVGRLSALRNWYRDLCWCSLVATILINGLLAPVTLLFKITSCGLMDRVKTRTALLTVCIITLSILMVLVLCPPV